MVDTTPNTPELDTSVEGNPSNRSTHNQIRLETSDGHFVANVEPVIPGNLNMPDDVVFWGERIFTKRFGNMKTPYVWRETLPCIVHIPQGGGSDD